VFTARTFSAERKCLRGANKFKDGRTSLNDDPQKHRGRLRTSHTDENCVTVEGLIREDRRPKVCEIAEVTSIAKSTAHEIISDLNLCKVSACWVLKVLTEKHKSKRMAASLENLCCYQDEGELFVESIVMGDETWVFEFTPESKRNSMTWKHPHSPTTKKKKFKILNTETVISNHYEVFLSSITLYSSVLNCTQSSKFTLHSCPCTLNC
jgi:hypothetical protein